MSNLERWEIEPFERFHEQHHRGADLLHMLCEAVYFIQARPMLIEQLRSEWPAEKFERELNRAEHNSYIAKTEVESDHPLLHAQAAILLWGGLEALLSDFLAQWLARKSEARALQIVRSLKISLTEYDTLSQDERAVYLLERLEERLGSRRAGGIERFEVLFRTFGLGSPIDAEVARNLLELSAVRNLIVHRRGVVDARFRQQCPWISWDIGRPVLLSHNDYHRYFDAVDLYVFEVTQRLLVWHGRPRSGHEPTCRFHRNEEPNRPPQPTCGAES